MDNARNFGRTGHDDRISGGALDAAPSPQSQSGSRGGGPNLVGRGDGGRRWIRTTFFTRREVPLRTTERTKFPGPRSRHSGVVGPDA